MWKLVPSRDMESVGQRGKTKKNTEHQSGETPPQHCIPPKLIPIYHPITRRSQETSLSFLTRRFAKLLSQSVDGVLDLKFVAQELRVSKRRVYDITNVLEGIKLVKKTSKNHIQWLSEKRSEPGERLIAYERRDLTALIKEEEKLDELIKSCARQIGYQCQEFYSRRFAYLTYEDVSQLPSLKEQTVIVIRAPAETQVRVPHPEESLQVHIISINGPVDAFLLSEKTLPTECATASGVGASLVNPAAPGNEFFFPLTAKPSFNTPTAEDAKSSCGMNGASRPQSELTSPVTVTPAPNSPPPPSEDDHNYATSPLGPSLVEENYVLNPDEGIADLVTG
uniref:E2F/DP family winged-helix DNA-binding domain-containing protein n=2 Tax=Nothobranchius kadleci TaxID=1051664 RepID=A0A1A8EEP1_NOTKA